MLEEPVYTKNQLQLIDELRKIYLDRIMWFRIIVISITNELDDIEYVEERLQRTSKDFVQIVEQYYGSEIASEIEGMIVDNTSQLIGLVYALNKGDTLEANRLEVEIAKGMEGLYQYLREINPVFGETDMSEQIIDYFKLLEIEIIKRIRKQYYDEIAFYDILKDMVIDLSDSFSTGMIRHLKIY